MALGEMGVDGGPGYGRDGREVVDWRRRVWWREGMKGSGWILVGVKRWRRRWECRR